MQKITTFLTFESKGREAVEFYVSVFSARGGSGVGGKGSKVNSLMAMPGDGKLLHASFTLDGQEFMAMDGGSHFTFAQGTSLFVTCEDQAEVDYFWEKLTADGGTPGQCGWLTDKFGVSWQIIPTALGELMSDPDPAKSQRVMQAMLQMTKINVAELYQAHDRA